MRLLVLFSFVLMYMAPCHAQEKQLLTLLSGACNNDGCGYLFVDEAGEEVRIDWLPAGVVQMEEHPSGSLMVSEVSVNRLYEVTFVVKKVLDEPSDLMMDTYVVSEIKLLPEVVLHETMILTLCDCEIPPCIFTFTRPDSVSIIAFDLPEGVIQMDEDAQGKKTLRNEYLNAAYTITYTIKKQFDYSMGNYYNVMLIRDMIKE